MNTNETTLDLKHKWMYFFELIGIEYKDIKPFDNVLKIRVSKNHEPAVFCVSSYKDCKGDMYGAYQKKVKSLCSGNKTGFIAVGDPCANYCFVYHDPSMPPQREEIPEWLPVDFGFKPDIAEDHGAFFYYQNNFTNPDYDEPIRCGAWVLNNLEDLKKSPLYGYTHQYYDLINEAKKKASIPIEELTQLSIPQRDKETCDTYAAFCRIRYIDILEPRIAGELLGIYERAIEECNTRLAMYGAGAKPEFSDTACQRLLNNRVYANAYTQFRKTNIDFDFSDCWGITYDTAHRNDL